MMGTLQNRIAKLEAQHAGRQRPGQVFRVIVRQGHEAEDAAAQFAAAGIAPEPHDLIIQRVVL